MYRENASEPRLGPSWASRLISTYFEEIIGLCLLLVAVLGAAYFIRKGQLEDNRRARVVCESHGGRALWRDQGIAVCDVGGEIQSFSILDGLPTTRRR